jgi:acylphosphatase
MKHSTFAELLGLLSENNIKFMTVGGVACSLNGFVRTTEDVDILVANNTENISSLLQTLTSFGQGYARELSLEDFPDEEGAVRVQEDFDLDIFVRMGGKTYEDFIPNMRTRETTDGHIVPFLDAAGLIELKAGSVREKDQLDVCALRALINEDLCDDLALPDINSLQHRPPGEYGGR